MINEHTFHHRGFYVEGRYFEDDLPAAHSFAFALACEYMRPIKVWHNAPSQPVRTTPVEVVHPLEIAA